jgi:hypothetical protein
LGSQGVGPTVATLLSRPSGADEPSGFDAVNGGLAIAVLFLLIVVLVLRRFL